MATTNVERHGSFEWGHSKPDGVSEIETDLWNQPKSMERTPLASVPVKFDLAPPRSATKHPPLRSLIAPACTAAEHSQESAE